MDRREFLKLSAAATVAVSCGSVACSSVSQRYDLPAQQVRADEKLLLTNAHLVDVEKGGLFHQTSLLIENGKIKALLNKEDVVSCDKSLDLNGRYVIPGLMNAHCHMTLPGAVGVTPGIVYSYGRQVERNAEECIKHGVTTVRDMLAMSSLLEKLKQKISDGKVIGPEILTNYALFVEGGYGDKMVFWGKDQKIRKVATEQDARDTVKMAFDEGADFIKIFQQPRELMMPCPPLNTMSLEMVAAICDQADKSGRVVAMHQTEHGGYKKAVAGGVHSFEHVVRDYDLTDEEIRQLEKTGSMIVPTLSAAFGLAHYKRGDEYWNREKMQWVAALREKILPSMLEEYLEKDFVKGSLDFQKKYSDPTSFERKHLIPWPNPTVFTSAIVQGGENIQKVYQSSVEFGLGNDGGVPFVFPGAIALEMFLLQKYGMKPADILKMATINNARLFKIDNRLGSITEGKEADLAIFDKNPLLSARNVWKPALVFKKGRLLYKAA